MTVRIIAGTFRGREILTPPGNSTRPTLGRVRESMFMILEPYLVGAKVLDLFAGSGALGFEAISRGAAEAEFVEQSGNVCNLIRENAKRLQCLSKIRVTHNDALASIRTPHSHPFDLILLDPPYAHSPHENLCVQTLQLLSKSPSIIIKNGLVIAQHGRRNSIDDQYGALQLTRRKTYGETTLSIYTWSV